MKYPGWEKVDASGFGLAVIVLVAALVAGGVALCFAIARHLHFQ